MKGVVTTITAAGVTAVVEAGEAHRVVVWLRAPPGRKRWSHNLVGPSSGGGIGGRGNGGVAEGAAEGETLVKQPGQLAAAVAEAPGGGGIARGERSAWDGSSTPSCSSSFSSTDDHREVVVVPGKR